MDVIVIAQMDNTIDNTFESANRIYSIDGLAPTLPTGCGGGHTPKILEISKIGYICSFDTGVTEEFFHPSVEISHALVSRRHDKAILERVWKTKT